MRSSHRIADEGPQPPLSNRPSKRHDSRSHSLTLHDMAVSPFRNNEDENLLNANSKDSAEKKLKRARRFAELEKDIDDPLHYTICLYCCKLKRKNVERTTLGLGMVISVITIFCLIQVALIFNSNERPLRIVIQPILFNIVPFLHLIAFFTRLLFLEIYSRKGKKMPKVTSLMALFAFFSQNIELLVLLILGGFSPINASRLWMMIVGASMAPFNLYLASIWTLGHANKYHTELPS